MKLFDEELKFRLLVITVNDDGRIMTSLSTYITIYVILLLYAHIYSSIH